MSFRSSKEQLTVRSGDVRRRTRLSASVSRYLWNAAQERRGLLFGVPLYVLAAHTINEHTFEDVFSHSS